MNKSFFESIQEGQEVCLLDCDFNKDYDFDESLPRYTRATVKKVYTNPAYPLYKRIKVTIDEVDRKTEQEWEIIDNKSAGPYMLLCHVFENKRYKAICDGPQGVREGYDFIIKTYLDNLDNLEHDLHEQQEELSRQREYYNQMLTCPIMDESRGENEGESA